MPTFNWVISGGTKKRSKPRVLRNQFGDGYSQRIADGINTDAKTWDVAIQYRTTTEADAIEAFLDARGGVDSFDWTPPLSATAIKVICQTWDRDIAHGAAQAISAVFEQVFE